MKMIEEHRNLIVISFLFFFLALLCSMQDLPPGRPPHTVLTAATAFANSVITTVKLRVEI